MIARSDITGLVLAGGRAQRMGGVDKGLIQFQGKALIEHAIERLTPQVSHLLINANRNQETYSQYGYPILADESADFSGPLAGYLVGLKACQTPYLITVPCDSPCFPKDLATRLANALEDQGADIAFASTEDRVKKVWAQPVFCLMKKSLTQSLEQFLAGGHRKIDRWFALEKACTVVFSRESDFVNANTPEELHQLEKDWSSCTANDEN